MSTHWETEDREAWRRSAERAEAAERRAEAAAEGKDIFLSFAKSLERNWPVSMALILAASIVLSIV